MAANPPAPDRDTPQLFDELRERRRDLVKTFGPAILLTLAGFAVAFFFVEPAPPRELVIATGSRQGNYYAAAQKYAHVLRRNGVTLKIRETAGSIENYQLLQDDKNVHVAIVQGGSAPGGVEGDRLESLASLYLEPVWVFYRESLALKQLTDLAGKRVAVGKAGSGTRVLADLLLSENGVGETPGTKLLERGGRAAAELLKAGDVDAMFVVLSPHALLVRELLESEGVELLDFERSGAYSRRHHFLESVVLEPGVIDLAKNLPRRRIRLIAPYANLVATRELHDALIPLLLQAATDAHESGGLLLKSGELPSLAGVEFSTNEVARQYLKHGPSLFQRHLSFWLASLIDRAKIMLIPMIALLIPLFKIAPPVYRWRIRSRIYRWYAILRGVDQKLREEQDEDLRWCEEKLAEMELELVDVIVPLSYMEEFYNLRLHIDLVKRRLADKRQASGPENEP